MWQRYPHDKQRHALATLLDLNGWKELTGEQWMSSLGEAIRIQEYVRDQVFLTRKKDHDNPFRQTTFRDEAERIAVIGTPENNTFVKQLRVETEEFRKRVEEAKRRG